MTTDRELMQQALEALVYLQGIVDTERGPKAAKALRERLAQPEHDWQAEYIKQVELHNQTLDELRDALAQPEQETVMAEYKFQTYAAYKTPEGDMKIGVVPDDAPLTLNGVPLYPRRDWVGLTEGTITHIAAEQLLYEDMPYEQYEQALQAFARAIEAKLKENNA